MPGERIEFDDAEAVLIAYLKIALQAIGDTAKVGTQRTPKTGERYVRVVRTGGRRDTIITDRPVLTFECWAASDVDAASLATVTRGIVQALDNDAVGEAYVSWRNEVGGPAWNPHPDTALPRYTHSQEMTLQGRSVGG